jgi:hypothetical protein
MKKKRESQHPDGDEKTFTDTERLDAIAVFLKKLTVQDRIGMIMLMPERQIEWGVDPEILRTLADGLCRALEVIKNGKK